VSLFHVIISLIIGVIVGFGIGILFVDSDDIEIFSDQFATYDCAKNYDKWRTFQEKDKSYSSEPNKTSLEYWLYGHNELMENRCFITVKSWAHQSDYEKVIWGENWEGMSHVNQMYLGETPCVTEDNCKTIKEQRDAYWDYLKSKQQ